MEKVDLTQGKVGRVLLVLAVPIMGSSLLQFTYNLVDMFWVGHLGSESVASIGSSSFFTSLGYAINALIMIGTSIKVSHHMGKDDLQGVKDYIRSGMILSGILGSLYAVILLGWGRHLISFLNLNNMRIEQEAYQYLAWSAPMLFCAFFNNLFSRLFASLGNSKSALKISALGIGLNIILDPLFIYGLKWGVVGAAIATLLANGVMLALYCLVGKDLLCFRQKQKVDFSKIRDIIRLGSPIAMQRVLFTLINILLARMIATFGAEAIAAQKIGAQIESVTYMVTGGLNGAVASFIGQNYGAHQSKRLQEGYQVAMGIGIGYAAISSIIFLLVPDVLAGWFVSDSRTISIAASYLQIIACSQIFNAMEMVCNGFFTGIGKPKIPSTVSMIFTALRLPFAAVCIMYLGINGIWWSITLSTILKGTVLVIIYRITIRGQMNRLLKK